MKSSTKAALLSALLFPGSGHFYLKKYISGSALFVLTGAGLWYLVTTVVERAMLLVEQIQSGVVAPDVAAISDLVAKQSAAFDYQLANIATWVITVCWVIGIVDSFRVGSAKDKNSGAASN